MKDYSAAILDRTTHFLFPIYQVWADLPSFAKPNPPSLKERFLYNGRIYKTTAIKVINDPGPLTEEETRWYGDTVAIWLEIKAERKRA